MQPFPSRYSASTFVLSFLKLLHVSNLTDRHSSFSHHCTPSVMVPALFCPNVVWPYDTSLWFPDDFFRGWNYAVEHFSKRECCLTRPVTRHLLRNFRSLWYQPTAAQRSKRESSRSNLLFCPRTRVPIILLHAIETACIWKTLYASICSCFPWIVSGQTYED